MNDSMRYEILEDGTISIETDGISGTNHKSADELLESLADMVGGEVEIKSRRKHVHHHSRQEEHHHH